MTSRALAMPDHVATLTDQSLTLIGLQPETLNDVTVCPLLYEDGSALSLVTMCIAKRGWFYEKPMLTVSLVGIDEETKIVKVYLKQLMVPPIDDTDVQFLMRYGAMVKAMLGTHSRSSNMGKLVNLRRRATIATGLLTETPSY